MLAEKAGVNAEMITQNISTYTLISMRASLGTLKLGISATAATAPGPICIVPRKSKRPWSIHGLPSEDARAYARQAFSLIVGSIWASVTEGARKYQSSETATVGMPASKLL